MQFFKKLVMTEELIAKVLLVGVVILVFFAAVMRSAGYPVPWSVDMAQLLFAWFAFMAASQALRRDSHIGVDFFTRNLPIKYQKYISLSHYILIGLFLIVIVVFGVKLSLDNKDRVLNSLPLSYSLVTISVSIGSLLMLKTVISKIKGLISKK